MHCLCVFCFAFLFACVEYFPPKAYSFQTWARDEETKVYALKFKIYYENSNCRGRNVTKSAVYILYKQFNSLFCWLFSCICLRCSMSGSDQQNVVLQSSGKIFSTLKDLYSLGLSPNRNTNRYWIRQINLEETVGRVIGSLEFFIILFVPTLFFS